MERRQQLGGLFSFGVVCPPCSGTRYTPFSIVPCQGRGLLADSLVMLKAPVVIVWASVTQYHTGKAQNSSSVFSHGSGD